MTTETGNEDDNKNEEEEFVPLSSEFFFSDGFENYNLSPYHTTNIPGPALGLSFKNSVAITRLCDPLRNQVNCRTIEQRQRSFRI